MQGMGLIFLSSFLGRPRWCAWCNWTTSIDISTMASATCRYEVTWTGAGGGKETGHVYLPASIALKNVRQAGRTYNTASGTVWQTFTPLQLSVSKNGATRDIAVVSTYSTN